VRERVTETSAYFEARLLGTREIVRATFNKLLESMPAVVREIGGARARERERENSEVNQR
jgi:hypothetical protein